MLGLCKCHKKCVKSLKTCPSRAMAHRRDLLAAPPRLLTLLFLSSPLRDGGGGRAARTGSYSRVRARACACVCVCVCVCMMGLFCKSHHRVANTPYMLAMVINYWFWLFNQLTHSCGGCHRTYRISGSPEVTLAGGKTMTRRHPGKRRILCQGK